MIAFVTGASGFIGSHLVEALLAKGFHVRALVRKTSSLRWLQSLKIERVEWDLTGAHFPLHALKGVDYVFHLAGVIQAVSDEEFYQGNVELTRLLVEAVAQTKPDLKKFVLVSSQAAGGPSVKGQPVSEDDPPHPVSVYGRTKLAGEKMALGFTKAFPLVILRPPTIYGPRDDRVFAAFRMMNRGIALAVGFQPKFVSLCYVDDLIQAILLAALKRQESGRIYNVSGPAPSEWLEFLAAVGRALGRPYRVFKIPKIAAYFLGMAGEAASQILRRPMLFSWERVKEFVQNDWVIDGTRLREELGWKEKETLESGAAKTVKWYQEAHWL